MANVQEEGKKTNKLQWFFFVIVVPVIFAITLVLVILTIIGVNPFQAIQEYGSKVPIISSFIDDPEEEAREQQLSRLEASIRNQEAIINDLESQITSKDGEIEDLLEQTALLEAQLEQREESQATHDQLIKSLTVSFSEMDAKVAADILIEMDRSIALDILESIANDVRGNILAAMEPQSAAQYTDALIRRANN